MTAMLAACTENPGAVPRQPDRQVSFDSEGAVGAELLGVRMVELEAMP